ncbi:MAG: glycosyltransferase family 2 protein [Chitinophagaceae bacterium]|nr:MAG: glycosyltransferase family 2 protein [Chitinophagaceae bacterium]
MLVSVIVPNYNHAQFLERRIESILSQTYQNFELLLFDDCSTDNSREMLLQYCQHPKVVHHVFNTSNSGSTFKQWEKGFQLAKGNLIWIAESDDYADVRFLEKMVQAHESYPTAGLVYCNSVVVNEKDEVLADDHYKPPLPRYSKDFFNRGVDECRDYLSQECTISNASSVVFKKKYIDEVTASSGGFNLAGDWMFYVRLLAISDLYFITEKLNYFRTHGNNVRSRTNHNKGILETLSVLDFLIQQKIVDKARAIRRLDAIWQDSYRAFRNGISRRPLKKTLRSLYYYNQTIFKVWRTKHQLKALN